MKIHVILGRRRFSFKVVNPAQARAWVRRFDNVWIQA